MSGELKVTINLKLDKNFKNALSKNFKVAGKNILEAIKENTSKGNSSVSGGKFAPYKDPTKYPGKLKSKTPVNLELSGKMLDSIRTNVTAGKEGVNIEFYFNSLKQLEKYIGNHRGENGIPSRKVFPIDKGEGFSQNIQKIIDKEFNKAVDQTFNQINGKNK